MNNNVLLDVKNLKKTYWKTEVLKWINFSMWYGEVLWYIWPNWAWKTTTIKLLLWINDPDNGSEIIIDWRNVHDVKKYNIISYLPEKLNLPEYMTWREYLNHIMELSELHWLINNDNIDYFIKLTKFPEVSFDKLIKTYSKWMQQRLWLMAVLINPNNKLVILDEPVSWLDPLWQSEMIDIIRTLKEQWKSIFITTHQMNEVEELCDNVIFVKGGLILNKSSVSDAINTYWNMIEYYKAIASQEM